MNSKERINGWALNFSIKGKKPPCASCGSLNYYAMNTVKGVDACNECSSVRSIKEVNRGVIMGKQAREKMSMELTQVKSDKRGD